MMRIVRLVFFTSLAAGVWVLNTVHAFMTGPSFASSEKKILPFDLHMILK